MREQDYDDFEDSPVDAPSEDIEFEELDSNDEWSSRSMLSLISRNILKCTHDYETDLPPHLRTGNHSELPLSYTHRIEGLIEHSEEPTLQGI